MRVHRRRALAGLHCITIGLVADSGLIEVPRELGNRVRAPLLERFTDRVVDAFETARIRRVLDRVQEQRVRERVRVSIRARWLEHSSGHGLVDHVEQLVLAARTGGQGEIDVEHAADDRGGREDIARTLGQTIETPRHEVAHRDREPQLRGLLPDPSLALVPDLALLDERAQHLNDEEWVSLGVSVQYREELAPQLLTARRRGEPLLELRPR